MRKCGVTGSSRGVGAQGGYTAPHVARSTAKPRLNATRKKCSKHATGTGGTKYSPGVTTSVQSVARNVTTSSVYAIDEESRRHHSRPSESA